ncbi:MAG: hypothetical protein ACLTX6_02035 [Lachnospiraceae bacterium]
MPKRILNVGMSSDEYIEVIEGIEEERHWVIRICEHFRKECRQRAEVASGDAAVTGEGA